METIIFLILSSLAVVLIAIYLYKQGTFKNDI
jgi:hypothetical protein